MSDQCKYCTLRGKLKECQATDCGHHDNWINQQLRAENEQMLEALKMAYRKHHLHDESIGWEELSGIMHDALCETMGDKEYLLWLGGY